MRHTPGASNRAKRGMTVLYKVTELISRPPYVTLMKFDALNIQVFCELNLCLAETAIILEHDDVIYVPILSAFTETVEPNFIFSIYIYTERILFIPVERTKRPITILKLYVQHGFYKIPGGFEIASVFEVSASRRHKVLQIIYISTFRTGN